MQVPLGKGNLNVVVPEFSDDIAVDAGTDPVIIVWVLEPGAQL